MLVSKIHILLYDYDSICNHIGNLDYNSKKLMHKLSWWTDTGTQPLDILGLKMTIILSPLP